jgi:hypothetical protein
MVESKDFNIKNTPHLNGHIIQSKSSFFRKVVIWGHKPFTHTHSFIHSSYYKAFKKLGYDTYWFDHKDNTCGFNFENTIFFTEDQAHMNIPLNKTSFYILHHCNLAKYLDNSCHYINLGNYTDNCRLDAGFEKLTYYSFFDRKNSTLCQPWGTDLLPDEFYYNLIPFNKSKNKIYYIGSITDDNREMIKTFEKACIDNKKKFINLNDVSDEKARQYIQKSYISPDIRCLHHVNIGYIPCRIFKNISYGAIPATNSLICKEFFNGVLPFAEDVYQLFAVNEEYIKNDKNREKSKWLINEVKLHHTYITRVNTLLQLIKNL